MSPAGVKTSSNLAILGGDPAFKQPLPVGQLDFPTWEDYESSFRALFERQYYTNQGPMTDLFEEQLADRFRVRNAICVTNATIALSMVAEALGIKGRVIVPAFTFIATVQSLIWSKLTPVFCDIDRKTHHLDVNHVQHHLKEGAEAILPVNLWGDACDINRIEPLARQYGVPLYYDSAHGLGCRVNGLPMGGFGRAEVFSFHATKVMSTAEGGCVTTNDDDLAERLRNIRSSYGIRKTIPVNRTANGRMSEAQAVIGLLSLKALDSVIERNRKLHDAYRHGLAGIPGLTVLTPAHVDFSNYQYLICEIDQEEFGLSRDYLHKALQAENITVRKYFTPGVHRCPPFDTMFSAYLDTLPETDRICARVLQFPLGARVDEASISVICDKTRLIRQYSDNVRDHVEQHK